MNKLVGELAERMGGVLSDNGLSMKTVTAFALDSRNAQKDSLFLAIKGARVDGRLYIDQAMRNGAIAAVVERETHFPSILVEDLVTSLKLMGISYRNEFFGPVVGVTGSTGKTTVKEMIASCLGLRGKVLKSRGNQNTEYSIPLVWCEDLSLVQSAVMEMSMRGFGQIRHLASICKPTIGVITNIGYSHLELVHSREGIAKAKAELFESLPSDGLAIYWHECDFLPLLQRAFICKSACFGFDKGSDCQITSYQQFGLDGMLIRGQYYGEEWEIQSTMVGRHLALGMACSILVAGSLGIQVKDVCEILSQFDMPEMRMQIEKVNGGYVLKDYYNASPDSMQAVLNTIVESNNSGNRFAILGGMRELGDYGERAHYILGQQLAEAKMDHVICYGELMQKTVQGAQESGLQSIQLSNDLSDAKNLVKLVSENDILLVKGSRYYELEKIFEP